MRLAIISFISIALFYSCTNSSKTEGKEEVNSTEQEDLNWNHTQKPKYSFSYPKDWELVDDGSQGTAFIVVSPRVDSSDQFSESVNLVTQNVGGTGIEEYVDLSEQQIEEYMKESEILSRQRIVKDQVEFHCCTFKAKDKGVNFVFEQRYTIKDSIAYILTYTAEEVNYEAMKPLASRVIESFKLK